VQFSEDNARFVKTDGTYNMKKLSYLFPLELYTAKLAETGSTVSIMISDYQTSGFYQIVTPITIDTP